jgi:exodeoxyribonuclease-3
MAEALGFPHLHIHGQKAYNGVGDLSRLPLEDRRSHQWCGFDHCRHAVCALPAGSSCTTSTSRPAATSPTPEVNPKFRHKLGMVEGLTDHFAARRGDGARVVLLGDLNIAPLETDVWSHRHMLKVVSHTPSRPPRWPAGRSPTASSTPSAP